MIEPSKQCTKCKEWKPLNQFNRRREKKDGLRSECKDCQSRYFAGYIQHPNNKEKIQRYKQVYRQKPEVKQREYIKQQANKKPPTQKQTPEEQAQKKREYMIGYRRRPEVIEHRRRWEQENQEHLKRKKREWGQQENHRNYIKEYRQRPLRKAHKRRTESIRRAQKRNSPGEFTVEQFEEMCYLADNKCLTCGKNTKLTIDHVIPISKGGCSCIHNIQPICLSCNSRKGNLHSTDYRTATIFAWLETIPHEH